MPRSPKPEPTGVIWGSLHCLARVSSGDASLDEWPGHLRMTCPSYSAGLCGQFSQVQAHYGCHLIQKLY